MRDTPALREIDFALIGMQFAAQHGKHARLAGAVGTDQADLVAGVERDVGVLKQDFDAAAECDLGETNHGVMR